MKVNDVGPLDANILLVGEAPGKEEARDGIPFVGRAGKMLHQLLTHSGIDYNKCRVTNVVDERPPGNDFTFFYADKKRNTPSVSLEKYWKILRDKIEQLKPKVVVPLGGEALRAITGRRSIMAWRGTPMAYKGITVIPTYHPSYVMRVYGHHPIVELDLAKARGVCDGSICKDPQVVTLTHPTIKQVVDWMELAKGRDRISFDIETVGKHIRSIAFATKEDAFTSSISIPFISFPSSSMTKIDVKDNAITFDGQTGSTGSYWNEEDEVIVLDEIAKLFADESIQKVGQNSISFDAPLLEDEFGLYITNHYVDTMHSWHVLYPELPKSLNMLCSLLTNYPNYWTDHDTQNDESEWTYNCWDSIVTLVVSYKIEDELKKANLWKLYKKDVVHPLAFALSHASRKGILIDKTAKVELLKVTKDQRRAAQEEVNALAGRELNVKSSNQVQDLLYRELKFPVIYKDNSPTVDEEALRRLEKRYPNEKLLPKIIECRKKRDLISKFLKMDTDADGRMRTSYNPSGTKNGRISSSKTIWGTGMDLQNVSAGRSRGVANIRNLFIAGDGNVFVKGDLRQAETMVVAHILFKLGDPTLYDLYRDPDFDIHRWAATQIFNKSENEIDYYERSVGKLANHSGNYCAGPGVLQKKALKDGIEGIDYDVAKRILEARHKAIPGLRRWWRYVEREIKQTRILTTCIGRRRIFFGRLDDNATLRDAVAFEPQSTVGDVCNIMFTRVTNAFQRDGVFEIVFPVLQVHDEAVIETPEDKVDYVVSEMRKAAIVPLFINDEPLIIPIDISVGKNWRDCKEIT